MACVLRDAIGSDDREFFFEVRNDPTTIQYSYSKRAVGWQEHCDWWLKTDDCLYVAEELFELSTVKWKVGVVRLSEVDARTTEIHFALHPKWRGRGLARELLALGREEARKLDYTVILARVDAPNTPSVRSFLRDGYRITSPGTLLLERSVQ